MAKGKSGFRKAPAKKLDSPQVTEFISGGGESRQDTDEVLLPTVSTAQERLDLARKALSLVAELEELKGFTEHVEAIRFYAAQAEELLAVENRSLEIRFLAERRAGQLLAELSKRSSTAPEGLPSLDELGITESQFRRWLSLATIRDDMLEQAVGRAKVMEEKSPGPSEAAADKPVDIQPETVKPEEPSLEAEQEPDRELLDDDFRAAIEAMVTAIKNADENNWKTTSKETALQYIEMFRHMIIIDGWH